MRQILSLRTAMISLVACAILFIAGCRRVSGTYSGSNAITTITINFKSSDKADVTMPVVGTQEASYEVDGNKITIHAPQGAGPDMVYFINSSDGSLEDHAGMIKLTKK